MHNREYQCIIGWVEIKTEVKDVQKQTGKILLTDADIVVSGGRGMKSPDNWAPLIELAHSAWCSHSLFTAGFR